MKTRENLKPQIVPTLLSSKTLVWSVVLTFGFLGVLMLYFAFIGARDAERRWRQPMTTTVLNNAVQVTEPAGWKRFARTADSMRLYKDSEASVPMIRIESVRDEKNAYCALDVNRALLTRRIARSLSTEELDPAVVGSHASTNSLPMVVLTGAEVVNVKPGIYAQRFVFMTGGAVGTGLQFYLGERSYLIWGLAAQGDAASLAEIEEFVCRPQSSLVLPEPYEDIERPVVDSSKMTAENNRRIQSEVEREIAMWRLFSERAKTEPASAMVPALNHFREAVRLLSSIRQESVLVEGADYARYRELSEARKAKLDEWFVLLDKYRSMKDFDEAKRQALYIAEHATLKGEAPIASRARDIHSEILAAEGAR